MKKLPSTVLTVCICMIAVAQTKTIYLNSKTITCNEKGVKRECLQYKMNESDTAWNIYSNNISGFTYNPGFFYMLQVKSIQTKKVQWKLVKVVSKTKSTQQEASDSTAMLAKPPAALIGQWSFTKLTNEAGEVTFTNEFLKFDPTEMRVNGKASCNGFFGNYTADTTKGEKAIHFEAIGHTMMACENLPTENKMLKAMELVDNWSVAGDKLYLKAGSKILIELTRVTSGKM